MSGLTLQAIAVALKAGLDAGTTREVTVYANPVPTPSHPSVTIWPADGDYVDYFQSHGANGIALVRLELELNPASGDLASMWIRLNDFLSVGTGNNSSIVDAVLTDRTLGGVVEDCVILRCEIDRDTVTARLPVEIRCRKVGAQT